MLVFLSPDQTSPYFKAMDVVNSAENVSLECGDMVGKLNNLLSVLMEAVSRCVYVCVYMHRCICACDSVWQLCPVKTST